MRYLFLTLFVPLLSTAQTNQPVVSEDYLHLVKKRDSIPKVFELPPGSANRGVMKITGDIDWLPTLHKLSVENNEIILTRRHKELAFSGKFRTQAGISQANRLPALQNTYSQGLNNQYMGPETGTLFSFGPTMTSLGAKSYDNSILRRGVMVHNDLTLAINYYPMRGKTWLLELSADKQTDKSIIQQNNNNRQQVTAKLVHEIKQTDISVNYDYTTEQFDHSNRNGLLNRVYQYSLLTPVSFQNAQNPMQSYSTGADNPLFLLQQKDDEYNRTQHHASIMIERDNFNRFRYSIIPTWQSIHTRHTEIYAVGTTGFPDGNITRRQQDDRTLLVKGNATYAIRYSNEISSTVSMDYNYAGIRTDIRYLQLLPEYKYVRRTHEPTVHYNLSWEPDGAVQSLDMELSNKMYISNTTAKQSYWLPDIAASIKLEKKIGTRTATIYARSGFTQFNSELPLNQSMASVNLLKYTTATLASFLPVTEVSNFHQLRPVFHREWTNNLSIAYRAFTFNVYHYIRNTYNDVLPVIDNNAIILQNIGGHTVKGLDLYLSYLPQREYDQVRFYHQLSLTTYRNRITHVQTGYDHTPVAGLLDVHTAIVKGAPINSIVGTAFLRDADHRIMTAPDGTPLADPQLRVIGNPNPDFIFNLNNEIRYKRFTLAVVLQWKKGGEMWNGTQSLLDYYGRSASSVATRKSATPYTGIAEHYIQRADYVRLSTVSVSTTRNFNWCIRELRLSAYVGNILLWTPYKGVSPTQSILDQANVSGLDLFNLPATSNAGISATISF